MPNIKYKAADGTWQDILYPVGAYYISNENISPATIYGGTWAPITDGRFMRPAQNTNIGGSNSHRHTTRMGYDYNTNNVYFSSDSGDAQVVTTSLGMLTPSYKTASGAARQSNTFDSSSIPEYRGCYVWYRTA